jgi:hypothetical protein
MDHHQYKEWLQLLIYGELTDEQHDELDVHLRSCAECNRELEELKRFHSLLTHHKPAEVSGQLLAEARQELRAALRLERSRQSLWDRLNAFVPHIALPKYAPVLGALAALILGIGLGRYVFAPERHPLQPNSGEAVKSAAFPEGEMRISNVRFINTDASDGEVEFTFDATAPVHIKGSINDDRVQKVLAHALLNDLNPGVRLRSVSAFATQSHNLRLPDPQVKTSLIAALKSDANPGVRKEALRVLLTFPFDEEIKAAFLHVLLHDKNAGLRIAAINSLDSVRIVGQHSDNEFMSVLKEKMQSDENNYVRIRAKAVLRSEGLPTEEVRQQ